LQQHQTTTIRRRLWRFHGGIHLPGEKELSTGRPVTKPPLPSILTIPLRQHIGEPARPLVEVGDWVLKGQRIAEPQGYVSAPVHASSSGTVIAIEERPVPHPSGLGGTCIVIRTNGLDEWAKLPKPLANYKDLEPYMVRERIRWAGIVGLGGAAFPTSVKLNPGPDQPIRTLVVNGAECEPYISCDDMLMRERPGLIIGGASILLHLLGARECLIGIEDNKPEAIEAMRLAVAESDIQESAHVCTIPTLYPSGGEKQLIRILTGKEVPADGIPAQIGILCQNVATLAAVAQAVFESRPLISRYVTLSGRGVKVARNFEVLIGTSIGDLLQAARELEGEVRKLVLGGPMMGFMLDSEQVPITKATNCILALTADEAPDPGPVLPCIRCGKCADVCPANLLPQQMYWYARCRNLEKVQDYKLFDCIECGCCAQVCPSHIPLVQYYRYAKTESWAREQERRVAEHARARHEARTARLARQERQRKIKLRRKKEALSRSRTTDQAGGQDSPAATQDAKKAAIEAARRRVAAKKAAMAGQAVTPKNTQNLAPSQHRQIDAVEQRREPVQATTTEATGED
jgi:electron transport complex protein RnfC